MNYDKFSKRGYLQDARRSLRHVLDYSGVGENSPLTALQDERLEDAYKEIGKVLSTIRED